MSSPPWAYLSSVHYRNNFALLHSQMQWFLFASSFPIHVSFACPSDYRNSIQNSKCPQCVVKNMEYEDHFSSISWKSWILMMIQRSFISKSWKWYHFFCFSSVIGNKTVICLSVKKVRHNTNNMQFGTVNTKEVDSWSAAGTWSFHVSIFEVGKSGRHLYLTVLDPASQPNAIK